MINHIVLKSAPKLQYGLCSFLYGTQIDVKVVACPSPFVFHEN